MDTAGLAGFREFVAARQGALLRSAYVLCGDRHRAEDLVQGALTRTAARWSQVRDGDPEAYVRRAIYHEQVSRWRRVARIRETTVAELPERPVPDRNDAVDLKLALRAALDQLAPRQRAVLALRFYEDLLREVLAETAAEAPAPAPDRAGRTWSAARRRRTTTLVAAAAAVLVAGLVAVPVMRRDPGPVPSGPSPTTDTSAPQPPPVIQPPPPASPLPALPAATGLSLTQLARTGPSQLTSYVTAQGTAVRPPGAAGFVLLPWQQAAVSPTGRVAVVDTTDATPGGRLGIIDDLAAGRIRWVELPDAVLHPVWSPDGRTVLVTAYLRDEPGADSRSGWLAVDTTTWRISQQLPESDADQSLSPGGGQFLDWDPSGRSVVGAVILPGYDPTPAYALRWWGLDGRELRTVRTGPPVSYGSQPLSPSGRRVAADRSRSRIAVLDARSGAVLATPDVPVRAVYGWRDEDHLVVAAGTTEVLLLGLDGSTQPYATRTTPYFGRLDVTRAGR